MPEAKARTWGNLGPIFQIWFPPEGMPEAKARTWGNWEPIFQICLPPEGMPEAKARPPDWAKCQIGPDQIGARLG